MKDREVELQSDSQLDSITLSDTQVTGCGLGYLVQSHAAKLKHLSLSSSCIGDADLPTIASFHRLKWLDVSGTEVTEAGLQRLLDHPSLEAIVATNGTLRRSEDGSWVRE